jgi:uncharacterized protein DUF4159
MTSPIRLSAIVTVVLLGGALLAQRPFREYIPMEGAESAASLPPDYQGKAEVVLGRLMYPSGGVGGRGRGGGRGNWLDGGTNWTVDYPRGDRTFAVAIRRLTRIEVRSVEQPVNPDDDDLFHFPYMHAGMPTNWTLTEAQAGHIREYLLRGGFMLCDSFFGTQEWEGFLRGIRQIFPNREITELPDDDPIFATVFPVREVSGGQLPIDAAHRQYIPRRRQTALLARHPRRPGPRGGGHQLQQRFRRFLADGGRSAVSGEVLLPGHSSGPQRPGVRDDALMCAAAGLCSTRPAAEPSGCRAAGSAGW